MTILEMLTNKINELKMNSQEEINRLASILNVINDSIDALNDEKKLKDYDFNIAINLVNSNSFGIIDLERNIQEAKNILTAKYNFKQIFLTLSDEQKQAIRSLKERLGYLKEELEKRINEQAKIKIDDEVLENLVDLKTLLEGKGRRKYYTYEMLESLFEVFDYNSFTIQDIENLISELSVSKNNKGKFGEEKKDFDEVMSLYQEYLGDKIDISLLKIHEDEICARIDLVNARNILEFLKNNDILNQFDIPSILRITIYGRYDFIREFYYEKVVSKDDKLKKIYFEKTMLGVWINEGTTTRRHNTIIRKYDKKGKVASLYSAIPETSDEDIWENIRLIKENESILHEKYDLSNIDYLWVINKPTWLIKKNLELFKQFNFTDVQITALVQSDLEDKIHFVIELGLLNTPRTAIFREIETTVPKYNEFMLNGKKKKHQNTNILDYYHRNTTEIGKTSYVEYIYWFYKMLRSSKEEFYQNFFSSYRAGAKNKSEFYTTDDLVIINDKKTFDKLVDDSFVTNYYDLLISNYDVYDETIREYNLSQKGDVIIPYFDDSILDDDVLSRLEEYVAIDVYSNNGEIRKVKNPYVYIFGNTIISRYKVLRNLTILKNKYGYLNDDMILTAVVRNSYIDKDAFDEIKGSIISEVLVK